MASQLPGIRAMSVASEPSQQPSATCEPAPAGTIERAADHLDWSIAFGPRRDGRHPPAEPKRDKPQPGAAPNALRRAPRHDNRAEATRFLPGFGLCLALFVVAVAAGVGTFLLANSADKRADIARAPAEATAETHASAAPTGVQAMQRPAVSGGQSGRQAEPAEKSAAAGAASARVAPSDKSKPNVTATSAPPRSTATSAAPPQPSPGSGLSGAEIETLLSRGDWLFATGDVASARLLYRRAAGAGEARAAVRLRETFDPVLLDPTPLRGARRSPEVTGTPLLEQSAAMRSSSRGDNDH
jgi:hypothetical protein